MVNVGWRTSYHKIAELITSPSSCSWKNRPNADRLNSERTCGFFRIKVEHIFSVRTSISSTWNGIWKSKGIYDLCPIFFRERNSYQIRSIRNHPIKQGLFLFLLRKRREIVLQWKKLDSRLILEKNQWMKTCWRKSDQICHRNRKMIIIRDYAHPLRG